MNELNKSQKKKLLLFLLSASNNKLIIGDWIAKKLVMTCLGYSYALMWTLERNKVLNMKIIGSRTFYSYDSLIELLNKKQQK